jgi:hypothetical protein
MKTQPAVEIAHLRKAYGDVVAVDDLSGLDPGQDREDLHLVVGNFTPLGASVAAIQDSMQGQFPPAEPLLVLAGYAVVFGFLAKRFFRWE